MSLQTTPGLSPDEAAPVTNFVAQAPNSTYSLNEKEKGAALVRRTEVGGAGSGQNSRARRQNMCPGKPSRIHELPQRPELTRSIGNQIHHEVTQVFAVMQRLGFFCQLPIDPTHTEIECLKIQKVMDGTAPRP
ncbi:hypothetical protein OIV83_004480 [Microbotryomycetes sp. JL201]|nr:hypothetical protein OIV83_004480 [Microbotryomycetes sp. JL201]